MSNEQCAPCAEGDHSNCLWVAGACPECGPTGCLDDAIRRLMPTPEQYAEQAQQLRNEQYAKAGLPMPGDAAKGALAYLLSLPGSPSAIIHSQEEFLTALDTLLDHTLHADECYIDDAQTECVCVIGKVRAALPPCGATQLPAYPTPENRDPTRAWQCTRNAHPASPDRHTFG